MDRRIGRLGQIKVYVGKCFRIFFNEKGWKKILFGAIISIIVAWVAGDDMFVMQRDTRSGAFAITCACIWIGIFNSIQSICRERGIIKREHRTGLHISSYIIAHMIFELIICIVQAIIITLFIFFFNGDYLPDNGVIMAGIAEIFITCFLCLYSADILAMAVSSFVKTENAAMTVMPFILIVQLVFSGLFFELGENADWISNLTISRYGVEGIGTTSDMNSLPSDTTVMTYEIMTKQGQPVDLYELTKDQEYLMEYDFTSDHLGDIWGRLIIFTVIYGAVAIIALEFVDRDKR